MPEISPQTRLAGGHSIGLRTLDQEQPPISLPVEGTLPSWLAGSLLRNGPGKFEAGTRSYNHWFDGLGMLHRFGIVDGTVTYTNRFVNSPAYRAACDEGLIAYSEFATDPCRSLFKRVATVFAPPRTGENTNVSIIAAGNEFLALTESALPVVFDPKTLETLGVAQPAPGQLTVAHPHRAPRSGDLVSYATRFGPHTTYQIYIDQKDSAPKDSAPKDSAQRRVIARLPVRFPSYMHSFGITERFMVLAEFPFVVLPVALPLSGRPIITNYRWRPGRGTRFRVIDLATGRVRATCRGEAFFAFHHVNAYERGDEIVLDVCGYDDPEIIDALYLDRLRSDDPQMPPALLRRYRLRLDSGEAIREPMPEAYLELPRIDYDRRNGRPYRYVYGVGNPSDGGFLDRIHKVDVESGVQATWREPDTYPGEPVFVRTPGSEREDDGLLLSVVLDAAANSSFLLVLDATGLTEVARARVPNYIPLGFHGGFFPENTISRTGSGGSAGSLPAARPLAWRRLLHSGGLASLGVACCAFGGCGRLRLGGGGRLGLGGGCLRLGGGRLGLGSNWGRLRGGGRLRRDCLRGDCFGADRGGWGLGRGSLGRGSLSFRYWRLDGGFPGRAVRGGAVRGGAVQGGSVQAGDQARLLGPGAWRCVVQPRVVRDRREFRRGRGRPRLDIVMPGAGKPDADDQPDRPDDAKDQREDGLQRGQLVPAAVVECHDARDGRRGGDKVGVE
jgi:beta,beta-carotene 9',10'-dioxygenase